MFIHYIYVKWTFGLLGIIGKNSIGKSTRKIKKVSLLEDSAKAIFFSIESMSTDQISKIYRSQLMEMAQNRESYSETTIPVNWDCPV